MCRPLLSFVTDREIRQIEHLSRTFASLHPLLSISMGVHHFPLKAWNNAPLNSSILCTAVDVCQNCTIQITVLSARLEKAAK
jgi:hypothetical protein